LVFWTTELGGSVAGLLAECLGFGFYRTGPEELEQSDGCHHQHHPIDAGELTSDSASLPTEGISAFHFQSSRAFSYNHFPPHPTPLTLVFVVNSFLLAL